MKNILLKVLSTLFSFIVVWFGLFLTIFFVKNDFSFLLFLVGLTGYLISIRPAIDEWENRFKRWFKINE